MNWESRFRGWSRKTCAGSIPDRWGNGFCSDNRGPVWPTNVCAPDYHSRLERRECGGAFGEAFGNQTPSMVTYTLNIQRQITQSLLLQVGYGGSREIHLLEGFNINEVEPGNGSLALRSVSSSL